MPWRGPTDTPTPKVRIGTLTHGIWMLQMGCFAPTTHVLLLVPLGCGPLISQHLRYIEKMCSEPLEGFTGFFSRDLSDPHEARRPNRAKNRKIAPGRQITSEPLTQKLRNPDRRPLLVESFRTVPHSERLEQKSPKSRYSVHHFSRHALSRPNMSTETSLPTT